MIKGLKRWAVGGILLREVRGLRQEVMGLTLQVARIADVLERQAPAVAVADPTAVGVEITFADDMLVQTWAQIELDLPRATGQFPTEAQVLQEYERRMGGTLPPGVGRA